MTAKRFKFNSHVRNGNKNVSMFAEELRKMTEYREYRDSLSNMLRDKLCMNESNNTC